LVIYVFAGVVLVALRDLVFAVLAVVVIVLYFAVPYLLLGGVGGFTLYCFWLALAVVSAAASLIYFDKLCKRGGGECS